MPTFVYLPPSLVPTEAPNGLARIATSFLCFAFSSLLPYYISDGIENLMAGQLWCPGCHLLPGFRFATERDPPVAKPLAELMSGRLAPAMHHP